MDGLETASWTALAAIVAGPPERPRETVPPPRPAEPEPEPVTEEPDDA